MTTLRSTDTTRAGARSVWCRADGISPHRLATEDWTYFLDVPVDSPLMRINRLCLARHVPEELR